jgi:5-bromo-4-chloroindolyl phosphate hydrolysis protein
MTFRETVLLEAELQEGIVSNIKNKIDDKVSGIKYQVSNIKNKIDDKRAEGAKKYFAKYDTKNAIERGAHFDEAWRILTKIRRIMIEPQAPTKEEILYIKGVLPELRVHITGMEKVINQVVNGTSREKLRETRIESRKYLQGRY